MPPRRDTELAEPGTTFRDADAQWAEYCRAVKRGRGDGDGTAYRPASECLSTDGFPKDFNELRAALKANDWIRWQRPASKKTGRPIPNRLEVHMGDWYKYLKQREQATPDHFDLPAEHFDAMAQEVERRKAEERRQRAAD